MLLLDINTLIYLFFGVTLWFSEEKVSGKLEFGREVG